MKPFVRIEFRKPKRSVTTGVLLAIPVLSLHFVVVYFATKILNLDAGTYDWIANGMWIVDGIIGGLLVRFLCAKSGEPSERDRPQGPSDH